MSEQSEALLERALVHDEAGDRYLVNDMLMEYARKELHLLREARHAGVPTEREEMRFLRAAVKNYIDESIQLLTALKEYV